MAATATIETTTVSPINVFLFMVFILWLLIAGCRLPIFYFFLR